MSRGALKFADFGTYWGHRFGRHTLTWRGERSNAGSGAMVQRRMRRRMTASPVLALASCARSVTRRSCGLPILLWRRWNACVQQGGAHVSNRGKGIGASVIERALSSQRTRPTSRGSTTNAIVDPADDGRQLSCSAGASEFTRKHSRGGLHPDGYVHMQTFLQAARDGFLVHS